jgi:DNA-binding MarR family transcriptional regulator
MKDKPPKWVDLYPQGTKEGDEEQGVFICLARNSKWSFRSVAQIAKESKLTKERVEEILQKYWRKGMVFQNPNNEDQWAYWERVPEMLPKKKLSITEEDQKNRIEKMKK